MLRRFLKIVIDYGICVYMILILAVMPLYNREGFYTPNAYSHIGTDKSYFFNMVTVNMGKVLIPAAAVYLAVLLICERRRFWEKLRRNMTWTDLFAAGYGLALVLSFLLSEYRSDALWGANGWYMGFWPQMFLVLVYFFIAKLWKPRVWMFYLMLGVSAVVFLLGYLNRMKIDPLGMTTDNASFISTIGNINWYCGYVVSVFFAGAVLLWRCGREKPWAKVLLMLYVAVGYGTLLTQGSDSGMLTLAVMALVLFVLSAPDRDRMIMFWEEMLLLGEVSLVTYAIMRSGIVENNYNDGLGYFLVTGWRPFLLMGVSLVVLLLFYRNREHGNYPQKEICLFARGIAVAAVCAVLLLAVMIAVNTVRPGSLGPLSKYSLFTFSKDWGSARGGTWSAGWLCFAEQDLLHKLVGTGPDTMPAYMYRDGSERLLTLVREKFGSQTLSNAHNEWLTVLVNTGILGLTAFAGMMVSAIRKFLTAGRKNTLVCACGFCMLAYSVNNIFSFQQAMNVATIFVIFGMGGAFLQKSAAEEAAAEEAPRQETPSAES